MAEGVLVDAKGSGYSSFFYPDGTPREWFVGTEGRPGKFWQFYEQAEAQLRAANGRPVVWVFAEEDVAEWVGRLLLKNGFDGIVVLHEEPLP